MEETITLNASSIKALSADTRVKILKSLAERRKTLTELSKEHNLVASTVKEHLETLQEADLVKQIDEGYKWKYWELTKNGKKLILPSEHNVNILLVLGSSIIAIIAGFSSMLLKYLNFMAISTTGAEETFENGVLAAVIPEKIATTNPTPLQLLQPYMLETAVIAIASAILIASVYLIKNKGKQ